jgi:hypothetical protein
MRILNYFKENNLLLFFVFVTFFPTVRMLLTGSDASTNILEYFISVLPEIFFFGILFFNSIEWFKNGVVKFHLFDKLIIFYITYNLIVGLIMANDFGMSIYAIRLTYLPMLIYFIASFSMLNFVKIELSIQKVFSFFVWIGIIGMLLYFVFPTIQHYFLYEASNGIIAEYFIIRMTSVLWTPVVFSSIMAASILYYFYKYLVENKRIHLLHLAILFICLFLSVSRGAMIAITFGIVVLGFLKMDFKKLAVMILLEIATFSLVGFYVSNPIEFGSWIVSSSKETVEMKKGVTRVDLWEKSNKDLLSHPFGLGLGKAGHVAARFHSKNDKKASTSSTDGWYLKLMLETGYIALAFYFLIALFFALKWWNYFRKYGFDILTFIFVLGLVVNVQNLVSNVLDFYLFSYFYWFIIGIFVLKLKRISNG